MRLIAIFLLAAALLGAGPAHAQREAELNTGSNIPIPKRARIPESGSNAERGNAVMREFARCTIDKTPNRIATVLAMPLGAEYHKAMRGLASDDCLAAGKVRFKPALLRGALFTELWRRRVSAESRQKPWGPVLPAYDPNAPLVNANVETSYHQGMLWFADCIVKRDRAAASDVILRPVGSQAQDEAYARLTPDLGPCLLEGQQAKFSRAVLEGALAEALYRAPATAPTNAGGA